MAEQKSADPDILALAAKIVSAHVGNNFVSPDTLPSLIDDVYRSLAAVGAAGPAAPEWTAPAVPKRTAPAVPIKRSVFPDHIICLEDGKPLKMLKRHLMTAFKMTPDEYRTRWGLPSDYPMVAPNYAAQRSALARQIGLGRKPGKTQVLHPAVQPGRAGATR